MHDTPNAAIELLLFNDYVSYQWTMWLVDKIDSIVDSESAVIDGTWTREQGVVFLLADRLKDDFERLIDDIDMKPADPTREHFRQLLISTCARYTHDHVNWNELAQNIIRRIVDA